jgi:colicin import membrane protein
MRTGLAISGVGHAAVLLWSVLAFTAQPHQVDSTEALPVDVISANEFSQITHGDKQAPKAEQPKPLAEKIGPATAVDDPSAKLGKKEVKAANDAPPVPPMPEPKPPEPKAKKPAPQPPDLIAEALKREENKRSEPKQTAEVKPPPPTPAPKKPPQPEPPKFDARRVAALLDKRQPERVASAGETLNNTSQLGAAGANANTLSQYEMYALREKIKQLWQPPSNLRDQTITIGFKLRPDGTLDGAPTILTPGQGSKFTAACEWALRALRQAQPYTMLRPEHYEVWQDMEITFDKDLLEQG